MYNRSISAVFVLVLAVGGFSGCGFKSGSNTAVEVSAANANANAAVEPSQTPAAGAAQSAEALPETLVAALYKSHDAKKSPFFQTKNRGLVDQYFTKSLGSIIWNDALTSQKNNEVGVIDGDPLYNAQDVEIRNFAIGKGEVNGGTATVPVTFTNYGNKQIIKFHLKLAADGWKIDDIEYGGDAGTLRGWFKDSAMPERSGTFEGKYKVGDTTCIVTPSKMTYEVRWAKGSGTEMFFFKENQTFETEEKQNGRTNRFEFTDDTYNTGTFYRSDGKSFAVTRAN
jgi:Protein of unknown function (DUF3828)